MRCLRNIARALFHEHPGQCHTVWSAHGATYCWICERSVTDDPVPGYALVYRDSGEVVQGRRGGVPTGAFFTSLEEATATQIQVGIDRYELRSAMATTQGIQVLR